MSAGAAVLREGGSNRQSAAQDSESPPPFKYFVHQTCRMQPVSAKCMLFRQISHESGNKIAVLYAERHTSILSADQGQGVMRVLVVEDDITLRYASRHRLPLRDPAREKRRIRGLVVFGRELDREPLPAGPPLLLVPWRVG
jgi:hypothetical protein